MAITSPSRRFDMISFHDEPEIEDVSAYPGLGEDFDPTGFDLSTFCQILEMDEDPENRLFSQELVVDFLNQAQDIFEKIQTAIDEKDLSQASELGHFLKGSSAALGLKLVSALCAKIQDYGAQSEERVRPEESEALDLMRVALGEVWTEYEKVRETLMKFYSIVEEDDDEDEDADDEADEADEETEEEGEEEEEKEKEKEVKEQEEAEGEKKVDDGKDA